MWVAHDITDSSSLNDLTGRGKKEERRINLPLPVGRPGNHAVAEVSLTFNDVIAPEPLNDGLAYLESSLDNIWATK